MTYFFRGFLAGGGFDVDGWLGLEDGPGVSFDADADGSSVFTVGESATSATEADDELAELGATAGASAAVSAFSAAGLTAGQMEAAGFRGQASEDGDCAALAVTPGHTDTVAAEAAGDDDTAGDDAASGLAGAVGTTAPVGATDGRWMDGTADMCGSDVMAGGPVEVGGGEVSGTDDDNGMLDAAEAATAANFLSCVRGDKGVAAMVRRSMLVLVFVAVAVAAAAAAGVAAGRICGFGAIIGK